MPSILLTAYEPYDIWPENASWLVLQEVSRDLPPGVSVTTRLYPVDFSGLRARLATDLEADFDFAFHLGQAPGYASITLEAIGLNIAQDRGVPPEDATPLADDGPPAFRTDLPISDWALGLRQQGVPARVSYHAGTYLCNAAMYLSHYYSAVLGLKTRTAFLHIPLDPSQVLATDCEYPSLPVQTTAAAVHWLIEQLD